VPSNLMPIAALTQCIENEFARWRIEPKNFAAFACFFPAFRRILTSHLMDIPL